MENVTLEDALRHPNWSMGAKITIDSATMMNKGLELIEARWLFDLPPEQIDILVHRESVVHSLVEYEDHSVIAQMGLPDMHIPIQYALTYPERVASPVGRLRLEEGEADLFPAGRQGVSCDDYLPGSDQPGRVVSRSGQRCQRGGGGPFSGGKDWLYRYFAAGGAGSGEDAAAGGQCGRRIGSGSGGPEADPGTQLEIVR